MDFRVLLPWSLGGASTRPPADEGSFEAGVLYHRACPSIRRVAVATPRRETRKSMTSRTIGSKADQQAVLGVLKAVYEAW